MWPDAERLVTCVLIDDERIHSSIVATAPTEWVGVAGAGRGILTIEAELPLR